MTTRATLKGFLEEHAATQDMDVRFAALKLIELLCREGSISEEVCQSVLREQGDIVDGVSFA